MREKLIRGSIGVVSILLLVGLGYFGVKVFLSDFKVAKVTDKPTTEQQSVIDKEQQAIIDKEWEAIEVIDKSELDTPEDVYVMLHQMANTLIVAGDGQIKGLKPVTKQRVESVKQAVIDLKIKDTKINDMLSNWEKQDFSNGVKEHNYVWSKYLSGSIGKAVDLPEKFKK
jgi:hypothetical protein